MSGEAVRWFLLPPRSRSVGRPVAVLLRSLGRGKEEFSEEILSVEAGEDVRVPVGHPAFFHLMEMRNFTSIPHFSGTPNDSSTDPIVRLFHDETGSVVAIWKDGFRPDFQEIVPLELIWKVFDGGHRRELRSDDDRFFLASTEGTGSDWSYSVASSPTLDLPIEERRVSIPEEGERRAIEHLARRAEGHRSLAFVRRAFSEEEIDLDAIARAIKELEELDSGNGRSSQ